MFRFLFIILWMSSAMTFAQNVTTNEPQSLNIENFLNAFDALGICIILKFWLLYGWRMVI